MKTDVVKVRPARPEDAEVLQRVHEEAWRQTYTGILPLRDLQESINRHNIRYFGRLCTRDRQLFVLQFENRVVGYMLLGQSVGPPGDARPLPGRIGEVYAIYLAPVFQGVGFGSRLLRYAYDRFRRRHFDGMVVRALADNHAARQFYENRGGVEAYRGAEMFSGRKFETVTYHWPFDRS